MPPWSRLQVAIAIAGLIVCPVQAGLMYGGALRWVGLCCVVLLRLYARMSTGFFTGVVETRIRRSWAQSRAAAGITVTVIDDNV